MTRDEALDLFAIRPMRGAAPASAAAPLLAFDPRAHRCHCGAWGSFIHDRFADRPDMRPHAYCRQHDPLEGRGAAA